MRNVNVPIASLFTCFPYKWWVYKIPQCNYKVNKLLIRPNNEEICPQSEASNFVWYISFRLWSIFDIIWVFNEEEHKKMLNLPGLLQNWTVSLKAFNARAIAIINAYSDIIYTSEQVNSAINEAADKLFEKFVKQNKIKI